MPAHRRATPPPLPASNVAMDTPDSTPNAKSLAAAYNARLKEKDKAQAVLNGSKNTATLETSQQRNFVVSKKPSATAASVAAAGWKPGFASARSNGLAFAALAITVAVLDLYTCHRLWSDLDAHALPSRLPKGPLASAYPLSIHRDAVAPKKPLEPVARFARVLSGRAAHAGLMSAALVLILAASGEGATRMRAAVVLAAVELVSAYSAGVVASSAPPALAPGNTPLVPLVRDMEVRNEAGEGAAGQLCMLGTVLPMAWAVVAFIEWRDLQGAER